MTDLIILDVYGTIVKADEIDGIVRPGLIEFLEHYKNKKIVVFTDATPGYAEETLSHAGILNKFDKIYDGRDLVYVDEFMIKNLEKVCNEFSIPKSRAVFIGDNFFGRDEKSAKQYGIKFIKIPHFRSKPLEWAEKDYHKEWVDFENSEEPFNFKDLIGKL